MTSSSAFPTAELQGPIYCWVAGKAPQTDEWNRQTNLLTFQQIQDGPKPGWATGYGMVSGRYSGFLCIDVDTKPERTEQPNVTFRSVAKRDLSDLPPTATVISGKPNRWRAYFRVPSDWWPELSGYSLDRGDLELRWEDGAPDQPAAKQSVIAGPHPDGGDLHFRWREGNRPEDVGIADAPLWLLRGMILDNQRQLINKELLLEAKQTRVVDGELTPIEKLMPKEQKTLLRLMSEHWPYRGGLAGTRFQCSYKSDGFVGLLGALFNLFGADTAYEWLHDTQWFKGSEDWGSSNDFTKAVHSVGKSKTQLEAGWGTLMHLATRTECDGVQFKEPAFRWPKELRPPTEVKVAELSKDTRKRIESLQEGLLLIDGMDTPTERALATQSLRDQIGMKEREFITVLQMMQEELSESKEGGFFDEICDGAKPIDEAIERFLPFGAVTMLGADPGTGKSTFIYRVAEAAAYGGKFMGQLQCVEGNVLVVQKDESDSNMRQKRDLMGMRDPSKRIRVQLKFSGGHFPELITWIKEHKARYVVMDSFASLFAGGADLTESDAGLYLYRLNSIAAEHNVAILLTHHLKKAPMSGDRQNVSLSDFYGSTFISAGTSDAWGLYRDPETDGEDKPFILKNVKPRSGIAQMGDKFLVHGNIEDLSLTMGAVNGMTDGLPKLKEGEQKVLTALKKAMSKEEAMPIGDLGKAGTVCGATGLTKKQAQRALQRLSKLPTVQRVKLQSAEVGGPMPFGYWWKGA